MAIVGAVYPSRCPVCLRPSDSISHSPVCVDCMSEIAPYDGPACGICCKPLVSEFATICGDCRVKPPMYKKAFSFGFYDGPLKKAIHAVKFGKKRRLGKALGRKMAGMALPEADVIVPVPLDKGGLKERGFNQAYLLALALSEAAGIAVDSGLLMKTKKTLPQIGLNAVERVINIKGAFTASAIVKGKRVILVDDVMTTGATVAECSKVLVKAGAKEVFVYTLARAGWR